MTVLRLAGLAIGWGVAALWSTRTVAWIRGMGQLTDLWRVDRGRVEPARSNTRLSVIVPARNEGPAVAEGLRSLLASREINLEVIAVDDRSTDETGAVMDALEREALAANVRYMVEHVQELPQGWMGKPHAMACGVARATGEWLLFTDADVVFSEDTLARALTYVDREHADHLLVVPTLVARSVGEAVMLPFLHVLSIWGPRLWRVADPKARDGVGVGAFNLIRRTVYDEMGGWQSLRMEVIEDVRMGFSIKHAGFASRVVKGRNLVRIRWAHGARGVVTNLTKNVFAAFRFRIKYMIAGAAAAATMCLLPFVGLGLGVAADRAWLWPSLISLASLLALYWCYRHFVDPNGVLTVLWVLGFPLAALLFLYAMLRSTILTLTRGGVVWRGTFYPLQELRAHLGPLR